MDQKSRKSLHEVIWFENGERHSTGQMKDKSEADAIYRTKNEEGLVTILATTTPTMHGGSIEPDLY